MTLSHSANGPLCLYAWLACGEDECEEVIAAPLYGGMVAVPLVFFDEDRAQRVAKLAEIAAKGRRAVLGRFERVEKAGGESG